MTYTPICTHTQAKERLNRAARESELRKARQEEARRMGAGWGAWVGEWNQWVGGLVGSGETMVARYC